MDLFQIENVEVLANHNHAGAKAPADVVQIAETLGFKRMTVRTLLAQNVAEKVKKQLTSIKDWMQCGSAMTENSVLLLQCPFWHHQINRYSVLADLKSKKNVKIIALVHDVEELRGAMYNDYLKSEFQEMLSLADCIIVHNPVMKQFFLNKGVSEDKLVVLQIFDYLQPSDTYKKPRFERAISIAGNLDVTKSKYLEQLSDIPEIGIHMYGPNFTLESNERIQYHGSFPTDQIASELTGGFGLVWDGESIESCTGQFGNYLRYNNPHKLSLYLSSGLPVVIWSEAAEAAFVKKHQVGVCVASLRELTSVLGNLTVSEYEQMAENVKVIRQKLISGEYTKEALQKALKIVE